MSQDLFAIQNFKINIISTILPLFKRFVRNWLKKASLDVSKVWEENCEGEGGDEALQNFANQFIQVDEGYTIKGRMHEI